MTTSFKNAKDQPISNFSQRHSSKTTLVEIAKTQQYDYTGRYISMQLVVRYTWLHTGGTPYRRDPNSRADVMQSAGTQEYNRCRSFRLYVYTLHETIYIYMYAYKVLYFYVNGCHYITKLRWPLLPKILFFSPSSMCVYRAPIGLFYFDHRGRESGLAAIHKVPTQWSLSMCVHRE